MVSATCSPVNSEDAEESELVCVDVLTPTFLFPSTIHHKDITSECVKRLGLAPSGEALKLYYLIDVDTREQQNHRMAVLVQDTRFSLQYVESIVKENELVRDRLSATVDAFSMTSEALAASVEQLEGEKRRRKAAETRVRQLEEQLALHEAQRKRGSM